MSSASGAGLAGCSGVDANGLRLGDGPGYAKSCVFDSVLAVSQSFFFGWLELAMVAMGQASAELSGQWRRAARNDRFSCVMGPVIIQVQYQCCAVVMNRPSSGLQLTQTMPDASHRTKQKKKCTYQA